MDEGDFAIKIKHLLEFTMAGEEKIPYNIDEPLYPDFTDGNGGVSTQADGDRPTYETTNPNLPSRMGVSFELAEGCRHRPRWRYRRRRP